MQLEHNYDGESLKRDIDGVSRETLSRLECYAELLIKWNKSINLVSRDSLRDLWRRHFLDSAQLLELLPNQKGGDGPVLVDLGSGAGFPGLVLAILGVENVHLIESDQRKSVFLREVARATKCQVVVHNARIEEVEPFPADVVTARAFAPMSDLLNYAWPFLSRPSPHGGNGGDQDLDHNGQLLLLKGKNVDQELTEAGKRWSMRVERFSSRSSVDGQVLRLDALPIGD
ncbi:16S rRNA (guanine(527)-N(7))-methyltransferase RsmG [Pelagibius sp. Alg239-R121]|uniref:16S rRNA (guanine(527)-N(7))-methyltransferase RsmG n=1 Tax=Pelagibius sp. Alg239-R121 TaxID=2993448 RepID=UPI0024A68864|nr:16S rRNA (guanine(527)-N(7))-methyltransferase RsmG [Pelagibius sp. Alg239-R121]